MTENKMTENKMTDNNKSSDSLIGDLVKILFALLLPPIGVLLEVGFTKHFWINILLTLLGFFPGMVHAVYVIARH